MTEDAVWHDSLRQKVCEQLACTEQSSFHIVFDRLLCSCFFVHSAPISATPKLCSTDLGGWLSHEDYSVGSTLRNLYSRVINLVYNEFNRRMVFVSLLYTGHPPVRHPSRFKQRTSGGGSISSNNGRAASRTSNHMFVAPIQ